VRREESTRHSHPTGSAGNSLFSVHGSQSAPRPAFRTQKAANWQLSIVGRSSLKTQHWRKAPHPRRARALTMKGMKELKIGILKNCDERMESLPSILSSPTFLQGLRALRGGKCSALCLAQHRLTGDFRTSAPASRDGLAARGGDDRPPSVRSRKGAVLQADQDALHVLQVRIIGDVGKPLPDVGERGQAMPFPQQMIRRRCGELARLYGVSPRLPPYLCDYLHAR
jgi:hypothetical protein